MIRIFADRTGNLTRVFHDGVELHGIESIDVHTIEAGKPIKADITFFNVSVDLKLDDAQVPGVQEHDPRGAVEPVAPAKANVPMLVRGKQATRIDVAPNEAELMKGVDVARQQAENRSNAQETE